MFVAVGTLSKTKYKGYLPYHRQPRGSVCQQHGQNQINRARLRVGNILLKRNLKVCNIANKIYLYHYLFVVLTCPGLFSPKNSVSYRI